MKGLYKELGGVKSGKRFKHGLVKHPLYCVFYGMKARCYNKNNEAYKNYGGRGIDVCDEWLNSIKDFIDWAEFNGYKENLHIDRIDNNNGYSPTNCRFVTPRDNILNRRKFKNNTSGFVGVSKLGGKWRCRIDVKGNTISLGTYNTPQQASAARDAYIIKNNLTKYKTQIQ